jgi:Tfp pilus assembly protein FimT
MMLRKTHITNYTMVELLLVIAVMGILLAVGVGGLNRVIRGTGATGGIRSVGNKLTLARTFSISSNQKVAVVFPGIVQVPTTIDSSGYITTILANDTLTKKYFFRSFRSCVVELDTSVTPNRYNFVRWSKGGEWSFMPSGTCANFASGDPGKVYIDTTEASLFDSAQSAALSLPAIVFSPAGSIDPSMSTGEMQFVVFEDVYNLSAGRFMINNIDPSHATDNTVNKGWRITINQFTGAITYDNFVR